MTDEEIEMFGAPVPGEAVKPTFFNPTEGYRPRGRYRMRAYGTGYTRQDAGEFEEELPMNSTALAVQEQSALTVTAEQLELIKRTVANGATADELKLYLFDCHRQGVHPLDKLVHFTKRAGKYTPITSIDFMRIRAAETNEYAGSDDAVFDMGPDMQAMRASTVTVWRLVQGHRCAFTATARWSEYKPDANDFMWKKMPHTMLAKCAEALALRKGFPRQLAGLYAKEEMDQAGPAQTGYEAPVGGSTGSASPATVSSPSVPNGGASGRSDEGQDHGVDLPPGALRIISVGPGKAGAAGEITFHKRPGDADKANLLTWNPKIIGLATEMCQAGEPCFVGLKRSPAGNWRIEDLTRIPKNYGTPAAEPLNAKDIAF